MRARNHGGAAPTTSPHSKSEAEKALKLYIKAGEAAASKGRDRMLPKVDLLVHTMALNACDNPRLQKMMEGIRDMVRWCQSTIIIHLNEPFMTTLPEHVAICEAICSGEAETAAAAMQTHIQNTSQRIQAFFL